MKVLLLASLVSCAAAQSPDVHEIMRRVALNQAKAQDARREFVYRQKQTVRLGLTNGKLAIEERREYRILPAPRGVHKELISLAGRYQENGKEVVYDHPETEHHGVSRGIDAGIMEGLGDGLTGDPDSRDGIDNDLFPLTYHQQLKYDFRLIGREVFHGQPVFRVAFEPNSHGEWKGEALIDAAEYQPVFVTTRFANRVPLVVRTVLGTNVRGLGFSVSYRKFDDGVWFPVSYGGEFELRAVFFYKRVISISMANSDFRRADVASSVTYSVDEK